MDLARALAEDEEAGRVVGAVLDAAGERVETVRAGGNVAGDGSARRVFATGGGSGGGDKLGSPAGRGRFEQLDIFGKVGGQEGTALAKGLRV